MSNTQSGIRQFLISILLAASAACFVYPLFFETLANIRQVTELSGYESSFRSLDDGAVASEMEAARKYNEGIADEQRWTPFEYRGENASDPVYESTLGIQTGGIMGDLTIPTIGVSLPIAHGTREEDLEYRCGHMYGSSLPVGGRSTHAVLAGHTHKDYDTVFEGIRLVAANPVCNGIGHGQPGFNTVSLTKDGFEIEFHPTPGFDPAKCRL